MAYESQDIVCTIITDIGYVTGHKYYDDISANTSQKITRRNRVKLAISRMGALARDHIEEPAEIVRNYDY